ncbi:hypothetical protein SCFA_120026 [anaerobic digester metagenome]|uniref:Uncharacterized protein n=1 Tax=anaerobic digester metagenome TaxID=1263854 RepID=A0A485LXA4_9ZZZZ
MCSDALTGELGEGKERDGKDHRAENLESHRIRKTQTEQGKKPEPALQQAEGACPFPYEVSYPVMMEVEEYDGGNEKGETDEKEQIVELVYEVGVVHHPVRKGR